MKCLFADDGALLASMRPGSERAVLQYQQACGKSGLVVSILKSKHTVTRRLVEESDKDPLALEDGEISKVDEFQYLGSVIASSGRMHADMNRRVTQASKAFGANQNGSFPG